jgi:hypothetical protein
LHQLCRSGIPAKVRGKARVAEDPRASLHRETKSFSHRIHVLRANRFVEHPLTVF